MEMEPRCEKHLSGRGHLQRPTRSRDATHRPPEGGRFRQRGREISSFRQGFVPYGIVSKAEENPVPVLKLGSPWLCL